MIDDGRPEMAVEFPGGDGAADMRRCLKRAGIEPKMVLPAGADPASPG
jgi:hypothetical protein